MFSSSNIAKGWSREEYYPKNASLSQIMVFIANKRYLYYFSGAQSLAPGLWLLQSPWSWLRSPADPELRGSLPQGTTYPFVAHGLGISGLENAGIHRWKQNCYKIHRSRRMSTYVNHSKYFWMTDDYIHTAWSIREQGSFIVTRKGLAMKMP